MRYLQLLLLILLGVGCNKHTIVRDGDGGEDPPPPPAYDYYEEEPNDELLDAQFITILPQLSPETIQGEHWVPYDPDCYGFWLDPHAGDTSIHVSLTLLTDPILTPKIKFWQTEYDASGIPNGFVLRGTWVGQDGYLFIDEFEVEYGGLLSNNDLIIELIPWGGVGDPQLADDEYLLEFWAL